MNPKLEQAVTDLSAQLGVTGSPTTTPAVAEALGARLAQRLRDLSPTAVVVGDNPDDAVLGHVVARETGATLTLLELDEGLLTFYPRLREGDRVVLVGYDASRQVSAATAGSAIAAAGATVVGVGSVVGTDDEDGAIVSIGLTAAG
ncbi:hypothetical protein ET475_00105 [Microbacterium protaetiae]|uniref:Uncharacterized protein n=1 Tax=Microbacterium protaetiae TaxID=2509458 RepID=A0A4V0YCV8_9MICO|nr:hypothetical protein [Microbacterium protaetiae]QAY58561.1 hypothetical protein ET475_00105 [Microbacterium protaetiae]